MEKPNDMLMTHYEIRDEGPWAHTEIGVIFHRRDLKDVEEPYLSYLQQKLEKK